MTSYFDVSDAEGLDLGDSDDAQDERAEALAWFASLEAAGAPSTCDHCGVPERFNVLCPDCEELCCMSCGRVECCCEITAADGGEENDMRDIDKDNDPGLIGFSLPLRDFTPIQLVSMRNAIDLELKQRCEVLAKELAATEHALNGTVPRKPRARRSDAGRPRQKPANEVARDEKGVAV